MCFFEKSIDILIYICYNHIVVNLITVEKSPSPVYGARLELVYGLIAHRGFESLLLRHLNSLQQQLRAVIFLLGVSALCLIIKKAIVCGHCLLLS